MIGQKITYFDDPRISECLLVMVVLYCLYSSKQMKVFDTEGPHLTWILGLEKKTELSKICLGGTILKNQLHCKDL